MKEKIKKLLQRDRKTLILIASVVFTSLLLLVGATYAYFGTDMNEETNADINAITGTTDSLSFSVGKDINLHVTVNDFLEGMESPHGETTATATLKANNVTNQATGRYNVFFIIDNNNFEYSTEDGKTELLLKVTDPNGNEVMDITGLKRVEDGFDITTRTGGFLIMADYDIEATPEKTLESQTWKLEVTFINLDTNQDVNRGKSLTGRFYITTEKESTYELAKISSIEATTTYNSITANLSSLPGTAEIDKYYYAIEEDTSGIAYLGAGVSVAKLSNEVAITDTDYNESIEATYTFDNLKPNTKYKLYSYATDKYGLHSNVYETVIRTDDYFIPIVESVTTSNTTTSITINVSSQRGSESISRYYYNIDGGELKESTEASYTFTGLRENTTHTIRIKVVDINGAESEVYTLTAKTIMLASITNVTTSVTASSIIVNVTAKKGDADIASYYYSKDNGATWSEATPNSSYTFNNLSSNTTYHIKVKVVDTEGRESSEAAATAKTEYVLASITNVTNSTTLNSITLNVTATAGSNAIVKYYYSKDNGNTYEESDNSSYTFNNLLDTTEYKIKIKIKDSDGQYSTEYYEAISTMTYINPSITKVDSTKTYNSISLTTTATGGSNNVVKYYYKVGSGSWSAAQTTNTYTITGLSENTTYTIYVKVEDANGRVSNEYTLDVTTNTYVVPSVSITTSKTSSSITINATGTKGDGTIAKYMYSKDGGSNWITQTSTSTSDSYTYSGLTSNTTYYIRVKVVDNNNRESSVYSVSVTTDYVNPAVSISSTSKTSNSITINYTGTAGSKAISYYQVSCDGGSNYTDVSTTSHTCTGLSANTSYTIRVRAVDTGGKTGSYKSAIVTTDKATASLSATTATIAAGSTSTYITYTGDGSVTCSPNSGTYASCSYNSSTKRITFTRTKVGSQSFTISATAGTNYNALASTTVTVTINGSTPTFTIGSTTSTISSSAITSTVSYTYIGDGIVSCSPTSGTYASCSVNTSTKVITFTRKAVGTQSFTIKAAAGTNYKAGTNKTISVTVETPLFATYIKSLYTSQGTNGLYYHSSSLGNSANDSSYRYAGANPNNYVCFGSTASTCPNANLYRIIGVFGSQVKLIKYDYLTSSMGGTDGDYSSKMAEITDFDSSPYLGNETLGEVPGYYWNRANGESSVNTWSTSRMNTINLNTNYLNSLGTTWSNKIATTSWYVGGLSGTQATSTNAKTAYNYELGANKSSTTYSAKIGLLYVSEYYYAASPTYWTYAGYNSSDATKDYRAAKSSNWLYMGGSEWVISRNSDTTQYVMAIGKHGILASANIVTVGSEAPFVHVLRPTFYLNSTVLLSSGSGTKTNPYRIN